VPRTSPITRIITLLACGRFPSLSSHRPPLGLPSQPSPKGTPQARIIPGAPPWTCVILTVVIKEQTSRT
jgi:hypothetical protein